MVEYTLGKKERLNSKTLIERLFLGGSKSFPAFPLRVVYMSVEPVEEDMAAASILISVPIQRVAARCDLEEDHLDPHRKH